MGAQGLCLCELPMGLKSQPVMNTSTSMVSSLRAHLAMKQELFESRAGSGFCLHLTLPGTMWELPFLPSPSRKPQDSWAQLLL